jgi:hypothetical protein
MCYPKFKSPETGVYDMKKITSIAAAIALVSSVTAVSAGGFGAAGTEGQCEETARDANGNCPALIVPANGGVGGLNGAAVAGGILAVALIAAVSGGSGSH